MGAVTSVCVWMKILMAAVKNQQLAPGLTPGGGKDAPDGTSALQTRERPEYTVKASIFTLVNAGYKYFTTTSSIS